MKINRILSSVAVGAVGVGLLPVLTATAAHADTIQGDFESFAVGSPNGQNGWQVTNPSFDVSVVDPSAAWGNAFGDRALRISNAFTQGSFGDQLFSPSNTDEAGETSAQNDGMSGGTRQGRFTSAFSFGSADPTAIQTGLMVGISPDRGDGARMGLVRVYDETAGLKVVVVTVSSDGADFNEVPVATGLARNAKHTLSMVEDFKDGENNDTFSVSVDGHAPVFGSSWEQYFRGAEGNPTRTVDSLLFRASGTAQPALAGKGLLIDDLTTTTAATPALAPCPVSVDAGTKTLTLTGDCTTTSTLTVPDKWTLDGAGHTITATDPVGPATWSGPVVTNAGTQMDVTNLTVHGALGQPEDCSYTLSGVEFNAASGSLTHTTVSDIRNGSGSGCQPGNAVNITKDPASAGRVNVTVDDVHVTGFQKTGIRINGKVAVDLTDSSVSDAQLDDIIASNSIQISRGARANVTGNTIGGNDWDGPSDDSATGVLLFGAGDVTFTHNVVAGTDTDVALYAYEPVDGSFSSGHLTLSCNLFERSAAADSKDDFNTGVFVDGALAGTVDATGNTVRGFATELDGVTSSIGGDCASGPVKNLSSTGTVTSMTVNWSAPTALAYAPVTSYEVTLQPGDVKKVVTGTTATFADLVAGRSYTATVVPVNAAGHGDAASISAYPTTVTVKATPTTVLSGKKVVVSGKVLDKETGKPVAGQTVTLWSHVKGVAAYTVLGASKTTAADGSYSFTVTQGVSRYFYVTTGGQGHMGATSPKVYVKAKATATIKLSKSSVTHGQKVTFSGQVRPKTAVKVELQRKVGTTWVTVKTTTSSSTGTYAVSWTPVSTTDYAWRVRVSGPTFTVGASASKVLTVS